MGMPTKAKATMTARSGDYDEAIRLKPDDAEAWSDRGTSYLNKSENARAIEDFNQALRLDPSFAVVLTNRGTAYSNTGDDAHAIADFNRAISLNPTLALAYNNRGISYNNRGQFDLAITDFNQAMRLSPGFAEPYYNRGRSLFERGRFATPAPDFAAAVAREPSELYFSIWLYLAQTRAGQKPATVLPDSVTSGNAPDLSVWPGPIISMFSGRLSADKLVFVAANPDPRTQKNQICEAHFYLGEYDVINGASRKSFEEFRAAMATCPHSFDEYVSARVELLPYCPGHRKSRGRAPAAAPEIDNAFFIRIFNKRGAHSNGRRSRARRRSIFFRLSWPKPRAMSASRSNLLLLAAL